MNMRTELDHTGLQVATANGLLISKWSLKQRIETEPKRDAS